MSTALCLQVILLMILAAILVSNVINSTIKTRTAAQLTLLREVHGAHSQEASNGQ